MFSHLCRACMVELDQLDPTQTVPLFEQQYQDVYLNQICNAMNLPLDEHDDLGRNVCKKCAKTMKQFYTFHSMFMKSNRKLRRMLESKSSTPADSMVQISLDIIDLKHKCKKCLACFKTRILLRRHVSEVHKKDCRNSSTNSDGEQLRWKCSCCTSRFQTRDLKNMHQKQCRQLNASKGLAEMTDVKENEFIDYNNFDASEFHSDSETNNDYEDGDYTLADKESKYKVDLAGIGDLNADERLKCRKCSECFETIEMLRLHDGNQHSEDVDSKLFDVHIKQEQLDVEVLQLKTEHPEYDSNALSILQQTGNSRWKCVTCCQSFETRELLRIHRRSHTGIRKVTPTIRSGWNCTICDAVLSSRDNLRIHKNVNHPNVKLERRRNDETKNWGDVGQYDCELCNKTFISKSKIRKHMDVHKNKDRPKRLCTICGLELCSTYNLNNHIRTVHGRERKFHCTLCDRRFSHSHHLKTHMNRHEGIRPFHCDQCTKAFFDKTTLREHIKSVHLNLKAYGCKICSRTFNRSGNMRAHMLKTHNLGDIGNVNRSLGIGSAINEPTANEADEEFTPRIFSSNLVEPFRSMIVKSSSN